MLEIKEIKYDAGVDAYWQGCVFVSSQVENDMSCHVGTFIGISGKVVSVFVVGSLDLLMIKTITMENALLESLRELG